jgi:hypothetical protein
MELQLGLESGKRRDVVLTRLCKLPSFPLLHGSALWDEEMARKRPKAEASTSTTSFSRYFAIDLSWIDCLYFTFSMMVIDG